MSSPRIVCIALALALAGLVPAGCGPSDARPNVIVIMVDTLRADYLGAYGFDGEVSPNVDALARESVQFDRCLAQGPWTAPSIASFLTSLHPQNHCVGNGYGLFCEATDDEFVWSSLSERAVTLAEVFGAAGFDTAAFVGNWVVKSKFGFAQGFDSYFEPEASEQHVDNDAILFERARSWLEQRDASRPFLLYLHLMDVHAPYRVTHADIAVLRDSPSLGDDREITDEEQSKRPGHLGLRIEWSSGAAQRSLRNWRTAYAAGVRGFDRGLGGFLDYLRARGLLDDSIVVLTSDHGEEFLEHGEWEHGKTYYNEALRVPLLIRMPDLSLGGRRVDAVVSLIDVMPTLIGLVGIDVERGTMAGTDLGRLWSGGQLPAAASFASALPQETASLAVQDRRWKLILDLETGSHRLFDLDHDPGELRDRSADESEQVARMKQRVEEHLETLERFPSFRPTPTPLSDEDIERLRSLGYLR
ncbi:MAG TPA: sulfatase [Candidatus Polarisedimenticolaceae bacterium]|nr:sulfatase [Candidatus Polarisedimenticolaceae bacterium]